MTNIIVREDMKPQTRIRFIKTILEHTRKTCPECEQELTFTDYETYCPHCGLVTSATYEYTAGIKVDFPYGRKQ